MKKIYLLTFLCLVSCGPKFHYHSMDPEFLAYSDKFETAFEVDNQVPIIFGNLNGRTVGVCHQYSPNNPANWIEIDPEYWENLSDYGRESLIFHELGHCVFGLTHDDELVYKDGIWIEKSIMNSFHFGEMWYYETYNQYYIDELMSKTFN